MKETIKEYLETLSREDIIKHYLGLKERIDIVEVGLAAKDRTIQAYAKDLLEQSNYISQIICDAMSQGGVVKIVHGKQWVKENLVEIHVPSYDYRQERNYMSNKQMRGYAATRGAAELMCERFDWEIVQEEE